MILEKIALGITLAAPIGPVSIEMIHQGLTNGFWSAFKIRLGGAIANSLCLIIAYLGISVIQNNAKIVNVISMLGAVFLIYMGIKNIMNNDINLKSRNLTAKISKNNFLIGFILALANPMSVIFWLGIFAANIKGQELGFYNFIPNLSIIIGVLIWGVILSGVTKLGNHFLDKKVILLVTKFSGILLIIFGIKYLL